MRVEAHSRLLELSYIVPDIVFVLYCQCYMCNVCSQQVQIYKYVEKTSLYNSLIAKKTSTINLEQSC